MCELRKDTLLKNEEYVIESKLVKGGVGITYLARQKSLDRYVAIKEFFMKDYCIRENATNRVVESPTSSSVQVDSYRKKFSKETATLASLDHDHIISVIDVWKENNTVYYSMPYLRGGSLRDSVQKNGRLSEVEALRYVTQVASALKYMHAQRLCHYDVKPANILLDGKGKAILIDFGISKHYDANGKETTSTPILLSKGFAPIEQYSQNVTGFSPASDVYALGATLYFLVTGEIPPEAPELVNDPQKLKFDVPVSPDVKRLIKEAMISAVSKRPQSMDHFLNFKASKPQSQQRPQSTVSETTRAASTPNKPKPQPNPLISSTPRKSPTPNKPQPSYKQSKVKSGLYYIIGGVVLLSLLAVLYPWKGSPFNSTTADPYTDSLLRVGISYYFGDSIYIQDYTEAVNHFNEAAMAGNANAQDWLASCYYDGKGVEKDLTEAVRCYRKAADQGFSNAQNHLGNCYYNGEGVEQDYTKAAKWYRKAAKQGHSWAQYNLGNCYYYGRGVKQDYTEAAKWYRKAAEQNNSNAQNDLGNCYYNGKGVEQNDIEAVKWYRKAADQGYSWAQDNLGNCYYAGNGVKQNYTEAVKWYRKAADQGFSWAQNNLGTCYYFGNGVKQDYTEAARWYRKAADQGHSWAQYNLGNCYYHANDYTEAVKWYNKSAEQNNSIAQNDLGDCYYFGNGVKQDFTEAVKWFRKAADQDYSWAQYNLGKCYYDGKGVEQDYTEAVKWFRKAADQGYAKAQNNLGWCYQKGLGIGQSFAEVSQGCRARTLMGSIQFGLLL